MVLPTPPKPPKAKAPRQRTPARIPTGPKLFRQPRSPRVVDFPGEPPPGFLNPQLHGSRSEWPIYAGLWKALDCKPDDGYRRGPFTGDPEGKFQYQAWQLGGRTTTGGAVVDFLASPGTGGPPIAIRVQTYRFHLQTGPTSNRAGDLLQKAKLLRDNLVVDVYEEDYLHLKGSALVIWMKSVLGLLVQPDPIAAGQVRPTR